MDSTNFDDFDDTALLCGCICISTGAFPKASFSKSIISIYSVRNASVDWTILTGGVDEQINNCSRPDCDYANRKPRLLMFGMECGLAIEHKVESMTFLSKDNPLSHFYVSDSAVMLLTKKQYLNHQSHGTNIRQQPKDCYWYHRT